VRPSQTLRKICLALSALGASVVIVAVSLPVSAAERADKDCADFNSQQAAQDFFESNNPSQDPHYLDGDNDGKACETLPCPCADGGGGGGGGGNPGGGGGGGEDSGPKPDRKTKATVTEITDGDTIAVRVKSKERDVRLIGIDTPEVFFGAECGGAEASASMNGLLSPGQRVKLIRDRTQDAIDDFGRLLRYVERKGADVGRAQVAAGWAEVFVFESPFKRLGSYRHAEDNAQANGLGVWGMCGGDFHKPL
jgi:endonuclease YncB( thermonuclease family)